MTDRKLLAIGIVMAFLTLGTAGVIIALLAGAFDTFLPTPPPSTFDPVVPTFVTT